MVKRGLLRTLAITLGLTTLDNVLGGLLLRTTSLKTLRVEALAASRVTTRGATLTTTHRVVYRVHHDASVVGAATEPAAATGLTALLEGVLTVADATDGGAAGGEDAAGLTARQ